MYSGGGIVTLRPHTPIAQQVQELTNMEKYSCRYGSSNDNQDASGSLPEIEAFLNLNSSSLFHGEHAVPVRDGDVMCSDPMSEQQYCDMDQGLDDEMDKVHSLVLREVMRDIYLACRLLDLPMDPSYWKIDHVEKWLLWTMHEYKITPINFEYFKMNGINLCMLSEDDFRARAPHCGDIIHAQLDIWRMAAKMNITEQQSFRQREDSTYFQDLMETSTSLDTSGTDSASDDELAHSPRGINTSMTPNHTTNIHLWQFLKELLLQPEKFGGCIRWLNREEGIFKIEDSVEVAKLWGTRKNRPAMNYDKLSRSIRQYYKKGIIKKTDVSQRLVYQFVKP